jgi:hypothetical protein
LRYYVTSQKVAGSIPHAANGFFNLHNPSSGTMTVGSTQPLTELPGIFQGVKGQPVSNAVNITAVYGPTLENVGASTTRNPMGIRGLLQGELYLFYITCLCETKISANIYYYQVSTIVSAASLHTRTHTHTYKHAQKLEEKSKPYSSFIFTKDRVRTT